MHKPINFYSVLLSGLFSTLFSFYSVSNPEELAVSAPASYCMLSEEPSMDYCGTYGTGQLRVRFVEEYDIENNTELSYEIYNENNVAHTNKPTVYVSKGINDITINLNGRGLCNGKYHRLEIQNSKKEKFYLNFLMEDGSGTTCL